VTTIRIHRPDLPEPAAPTVTLADRREPPPGTRLLIVDNAKPRARALLTRMAERVAERLRVAEVEVHTKASAGAPLDADVTRMLAARSRLVISGLGD
jgi:hypothetical protein